MAQAGHVTLNKAELISGKKKKKILDLFSEFDLSLKKN